MLLLRAFGSSLHKKQRAGESARGLNTIEVRDAAQLDQCQRVPAPAFVPPLDGVYRCEEKTEWTLSEQFDWIMKTNIYAPFWIIKVALPHLQSGSVIIGATQRA
jgi:NAD(P)-dependent dehydrogenase (short-subunit alcohol dehydrogenase family)